MFEFEDSKMGRVKVVNITETRSGISSIMNDQEFNYVITKNNRPARVIINYDTYRKYFSPQAMVPRGPKENATPVGTQPANGLKGLIGTREREIQEQNQRLSPSRDEVEVKQVVHGGAVSPPPEEFDPAKKLFQQPTGQMSIEDAGVLEVGDYFVAELEEEIEPTSEPLVEPSPQPVSPPTTELETRSPATAKNQMAGMDTDYYNRFRKLYESSPSVEPPVQKRVEVQNSVIKTMPEAQEVRPPVGEPLPVSAAKKEPPSLDELLQEFDEL